MEAKFLAGALSFLSIFLAIYAQSFASVIANDSDESSEFAHAVEPVIYYGDKNVNIGQKFEITCIIPITEKIHWTKNGESITRHNLRHGHDEHSYALSETAIEGPDSLVPNYDNVELKMNFYKIRSPLVLMCDVKNTDSKDPLIWKKQGVNVTDVASLRGRFKIIHAERKFMIDKAEAYDDGLYSCEFNGVTKNITAVARVFVRVPSNNGVVEGEKMVIHCTVTGSNPRLSWSFGNYVDLANSTERYILKPDENGVENALLMVENVTLDDRGDYKCTGRNEADDFFPGEVASDSTTVRVKGKFAALWPFLGICAEVFILCLIILIYEKRRNKSELEESDTDPQEQKKKRRNYD